MDIQATKVITCKMVFGKWSIWKYVRLCLLLLDCLINQADWLLLEPPKKCFDRKNHRCFEGDYRSIKVGEFSIAKKVNCPENVWSILLQSTILKSSSVVLLLFVRLAKKVLQSLDIHIRHHNVDQWNWAEYLSVQN